MKHNIAAAAILSLGLVVAGFLFGGGRYSMMRLNEKTVVRIDRWTGGVRACPLYPAGLTEDDAEFLGIGARSICDKAPRSASSGAENNTAVENLTAENLVVEDDLNTSP